MGRQPDYAKTLVASLRPRVVIPHHFDDFWEPLDSATAAAPIDEEDVAAFAAEVRAAAEALGLAAEVRRLELFESYRLEAAPATAPTSPRNASDPSAAPAPP